MDIRNATQHKATDIRPTDTPLKDSDYVLIESAAWFTVGQFSVRIRLINENEVACAVYHLDRENDDPIESIRAIASD